MSERWTERERSIGADVAAWLREEAHAAGAPASVARDRVLRNVRAEAATVPQHRPARVRVPWLTRDVADAPAFNGWPSSPIARRIAVLVLVGTLLAVALIGLTLGAGGRGPLPATIVRPSPSDASTASATVPLATSWPQWLQVETAGLDGGVIADAVAGRSGIVAIGTTQEGDHLAAAVWISPDGIAWQRVTSVAGFDHALGTRIATDETSFVAIGDDCGASTGGHANECGAARVWRSGDGVTWAAATTDFAHCCGKDAVSYAAVFGAPPSHGVPLSSPRFVLVGARSSVDTYGGQIVGASTATSSDGATWKLSGEVTSALARGSMSGASSGPAGLLAVGDRDGLPAVWLSGDGLSWSSVPTQGNPALATLTDVVEGPNGYVLVGSDGGKAAVWSSPDGRTATEDTSEPGFAGAKITRVIGAPHGLIALGLTAHGDGIVWLSSDGSRWLQVDTGSLLAGVHLTGAVAFGPKLFLFGVEPDAPGGPRGVVVVGVP